MCTLAIYFHTSRAYPVVVAANRDEFYARLTRPPLQILSDPWVIAGQDLVAGGTWLGVNAFGLVAGIVNRRSYREPDPTRRSRGQLCTDALRETTVAAARARVLCDPGELYNPFNLLIASPEAACVIGNYSGSMTATPLQRGLHVLTNLELNDMECPRIAKSYALFDAAREDLRPETLDRFRAKMQEILSDHSTPLDPRSQGPPNNLCVHTEYFGTRSSTVLAYVAPEQRFRMWYADGAPCQTPYRQIALPHAAKSLDKDDASG